MSQTAILHLSDIHICCQGDESFDFGVVFDPLIDRIKDDREKRRIDVEFVFLTGDIAFQGIEEEYDIAAKYLNRLMEELDLPTEHLFIVPGNHDVNRKLYRPSDFPSYQSMRDLNKELENTDFRSDLFKGQQAYFDFIDSLFPHLTALNENLIPFAQTYETKSGHVLGLLGLNSAWMCRRSPDKGEVAIGEYQIKKAMAHLKTLGSTNLNLACFHHPVSWLWKEDQDIARSHLDQFVLLTGHLHDASGGFQNDTEGQIFLASAGGAYLGSDSKYPMGYHYLTIDWDKQLLRFDFRTFSKKHKWILDSDRGQDGVAEISCSFVDSENRVELKDGAETLKPSPDAIKMVQAAVCDILQNRRLQYLQRSLARELAMGKDVDNINLTASRLVSGQELVKTVLIMSKAVKNAVETIQDIEEDSQDLIKRTWEKSINILGYLVLLSVCSDRLQELRNDISENIRFEIPVKTGAGIEIVYSGISETPARLDIGKSGIYVTGQDRIDYEIPEGGFVVSDKVDEIIHVVTKKVFPEGIVKDKRLQSKSDRVHLNTTLAIRKDCGEHFYFCPDELNSQNTMLSEAVYEALKQELPELDIICISTDQGQSFIIKDEAELGAYLTHFFRNKPEY